MNCKYCHVEVGEEHKFCPYCGKRLSEEQVLVAEETEVPEADIVYEETGMPVQSELAEEKPKKKVWPIVLAAVGAVVVLAVLAILLLQAFGVDLKPKANDVLYKESYTVEDDQAVEKGDTVVAVSDGGELTNAELQIYYNWQVLYFLNSDFYSYYSSYIGLDHSAPLDEQTCYFDEAMTWQQYFMESAIETWQNYQSVSRLAEEAGYTMDAETQAVLDALPDSLAEAATENGFESTDVYLQDMFGPGCTLDVYMNYARLVYLADSYYEVLYAQHVPTDAEAEAYFTENEGAYSADGITKESGLVSSVRHILLGVEGGTEDAEGNVTYSDDEWAACYAKAEKIYNDWKAGEATEESFAQLASTCSEDTGSTQTGGLYEGISSASSYVDDFRSWAVDMSRQPGDTGIVQSTFGYHIMYFVSGEAEWLSTARNDLHNERINALLEDAAVKWPIKVNYKKISLAAWSL